MHQYGADSDRRLQVPIAAEETDRAGIGPARLALELGDDLHGSNLGRPRYGPSRKTRAQRVDRPKSRTQVAADARDEVHHVRVPLYLHQGWHTHAARHGHSPHAVAS